MLKDSLIKVKLIQRKHYLLVLSEDRILAFNQFNDQLANFL